MTMLGTDLQYSQRGKEFQLLGQISDGPQRAFGKRVGRNELEL